MSKPFSFTGYISNLLTSRQQWLSRLLDPRRNIDTESGHPTDITIDDYKLAYERGDVAGRVVRLFPEESWVGDPEIFETEDESTTPFETAWHKLEEEFHIYSTLQLADVLSGIGRFGVLLLGVNDGKRMEQPVLEVGADEKTTRKLLYLRPLDESAVTVDSFNNDTTSPRYGLPEMYSVTFVESDAGAASKTGSTSLKVHWSRVIHVADNRGNSNIYGEPRMKSVYNRLLDLKKIAGGSAEMFWKGGFPGLSLEALPEAVRDGAFEFGEEEKEATKEQIESYQQGLQRYLALVGMTAKSLTVQVADPRPQVDVQSRLISMAMGVPWRIFSGSEAAELASSQDSKNWNRRIMRRRSKYLTPYLVRPLIDRLILMGVLPKPGEGGYQVEWSDLNTADEKDRAEIADKQTSALAKYVSGGVDVLVPPFHYLTLVLGMGAEEAQSVLEASGPHIADPDAPDTKTDEQDT